jgi:hypothetical protein
MELGRYQKCGTLPRRIHGPNLKAQYRSKRIFIFTWEPLPEGGWWQKRLELGRYDDPQHDGPEEDDGKVEALVGRGREAAVGSGILSAERDPLRQEESQVLPTATKQQIFKPCGRFLILEERINFGDSLILYDVSGMLALQRRELAVNVAVWLIELPCCA